MPRLLEVTLLFLRLGVTAFGGPAAHIALIQRECVDRRAWLSRERFLDLLGVASLIPGPTSTELAMHIGRQRAGWPGLIAAGLAFIVPAALLVGVLAAAYVRAGDLPIARRLLAALAPAVIVIVLQAVVPLLRTSVRSVPLALIAAASAAAALAGIAEIAVLVAAGAVHAMGRGAMGRAAGSAVLVASATAGLAAQQIDAGVGDVFMYFMRTGSLLFGSGYVLLPVLQGDLVERFGWLTDRQLIDAVAAGQVTPGPVFTTATFIGYLLGGPAVAVAATVGMFLPAFVFSAVSSVALDRLRASAAARAFLDGVNAAAVALIAVVVVMLARAAFLGWGSAGIAAAAGVALFAFRVHPTVVLLAAAAGGALSSLVA